MPIIVVGCNKGGAGKSTSFSNLAVAMAKRGLDAVAVDCDPQRSASRWIAEREAAELQPTVQMIEKRGNVTKVLQQLQQRYDYVLVDVAGRNSPELISAMVVADLVIAPHQSSQFDLDTLVELREQFEKVSLINADLQVRVYHAMCSTNPAVEPKERQEFLMFMRDFPEFGVFSAVGHYRKVYRDVTSDGRSVIETGNLNATAEIETLLDEVLEVVNG